VAIITTTESLAKGPCFPLPIEFRNPDSQTSKMDKAYFRSLRSFTMKQKMVALWYHLASARVESTGRTAVVSKIPHGSISGLKIR
jgi:hypothetical protein